MKNVIPKTEISLLRTGMKSRPKPFLIAGPCSAESRGQVLRSVEGLAKVGVDFIRAGVWKPRTKPGSFEGMGEAAMEWLLEARELTSLPIMV